MRILVYEGKHGYAFWMANTPLRAAKAREALFKMLDEQGCYLKEKFLAKARDGDEQAILRILHDRNGYEYETWRYEDAEVIE